MYVLKSKGKYFERFKDFKVLVEMQLEYKMKVYRLDNWENFITKSFEYFFKDHDIEK